MRDQRNIPTEHSLLRASILNKVRGYSDCEAASRSKETMVIECYRESNERMKRNDYVFDSGKSGDKYGKKVKIGDNKDVQVKIGQYSCYYSESKKEYYAAEEKSEESDKCLVKRYPICSGYSDDECTLYFPRILRQWSTDYKEIRTIPVEDHDEIDFRMIATSGKHQNAF